MPSTGKDNWVSVFSFIVIGGANALVDFGILNLLLWIRPATDPTWLTVYNTIAYVSAVTNSYIWNSRITFHRRATFRIREKFGFALQAGFALLIGNVIFLLGYSYLSSNSWSIPSWTQYNVAKGLSTAISSACSYFLMKYVVFVRDHGNKSDLSIRR
ncbi:GtrA family protein [Paenibacillus alkalitolerans]|uniref:GtrA family protein n=1 Tax=Paenibacillus alkalitolerans TaxID=2799335 RepID=UPI0018F360E6|nr:GtrA family protein [Paenibacillus alkalitolerans]